MLPFEESIYIFPASSISEADYNYYYYSIPTNTQDTAVYKLYKKIISCIRIKMNLMNIYSLNLSRVQEDQVMYVRTTEIFHKWKQVSCILQTHNINSLVVIYINIITDFLIFPEIHFTWYYIFYYITLLLCLSYILNDVFIIKKKLWTLMWNLNNNLIKNADSSKIKNVHGTSVVI